MGGRVGDASSGCATLEDRVKLSVIVSVGRVELVGV